jgi:hypothetical protein
MLSDGLKGNIAYSIDSFVRQTEHLQKELYYLGVNISADEAARISFLGRRKYDRYDHFYPGETFDSRLLKWLMNFKKDERQAAIEIVESIKFISSYEMKQLAITAFETAKQIIMEDYVKPSKSDWFSYLETSSVSLQEELLKTIFVACSDDLNFDFFRRYAMRHYKFKKDNFVEYYKRDDYSLKKDLPEHNKIFLLDQLSASGDTALRKKENSWKGKIPTFERVWKDYLKEDKVFYCPFIQSSVSEDNLKSRLSSYRAENECIQVTISPISWIPVSTCLANGEGTGIDDNKPAAKLCKKYYYLFKEDEHISNAWYGYGYAGLTLILQPNCPNDTLYLLWHNSNGWYPLFPRVSHHTSGA